MKFQYKPIINYPEVLGSVALYISMLLTILLYTRQWNYVIRNSTIIEVIYTGAVFQYSEQNDLTHV